MADNPTAPQKLVLPQLADVHLTSPPVGKALQTIQEYINTNVTPVQGNRVPTRRMAAGGNK
jgi:hypothetical protein